MSSTPYVVVQQYPAISGLITVITAIVSTNTVINLSSIFTNITLVLAARQDTISSITTSISGSSFTITQGGLSNVYITALVGGTR